MASRRYGAAGWAYEPSLNFERWNMAEQYRRTYRWDIDGPGHNTPLTDAEAALLDAIELRMDPSHAGDHRTYKANKTPILKLMSSLLQRDGIPEQRWRYWADPEYRVDRSIKDAPRGVFERNGNPGEDAYVDPQFIPYLRYFLFGAYLPDAVIARFEQEVGNPDWVTSGDIVPLGELARTLTRQNALNRDGAALEFYKLCPDLGLSQWIARHVRDSVMKIRRQGGSTW